VSADGESTRRVRPARPPDTEAVVALCREMMESHAALDPRFRPAASWIPAYREDFRRRLQDRDHQVVVCEEEGKVVGYAAVSLRMHPPVLEPRLVGYVTDICVAPAARRRGVGRALVDALREWCRSRGLRVILLRAACLNQTSQAFWRRMGWQDYMTEMWFESPGE